MRLIFLFLLFSAFPLCALDFRTNSGKIYKQAGIGKISSAGVEILMPSGTELLPLDEVSGDLLKQLSPKRKARLEKLIQKRKELPPEVLKKEKENRKKQEINRKKILSDAWRLSDELQRWLNVYSVAQSPGADAQKFAVMARAFLREFKNADTDRERTDIFLNFLKKINAAGIKGGLDLKPPPVSPTRHDIQGSTPRGNIQFIPPRAARYYKRNGEEVPVSVK